MLHLTEEERKKFKQILNTVFSDAELQEQFNKVVAARRTEPGDHQSAVLGLYASLVDEVLLGRKEPADLTGTVQGPNLETLQKKSRLTGPKTFQPKNRG